MNTFHYSILQILTYIIKINIAIPIYIDAYLNIAKFDSFDGDKITFKEKPNNKKVLISKITMPEFVIFNM